MDINSPDWPAYMDLMERVASPAMTAARDADPEGAEAYVMLRLAIMLAAPDAPPPPSRELAEAALRFIPAACATVGVVVDEAGRLSRGDRTRLIAINLATDLTADLFAVSNEIARTGLLAADATDPVTLRAREAAAALLARIRDLGMTIGATTPPPAT